MSDWLRSRNAKSTWGRQGAYLQRRDVRLLCEQDRRRLWDDWKEIDGQEQLLEDALLIGLVGGTGVGKSTFINALAGQVVSRSGDRRPTTDRVVVYRHADTELPDDVPSDDLAQPQVLHRHDELSKVVLFDFPDFDSAERKHADILHKYLEHLDVLLVVVDEMKYGDRRLYELLGSVNHAAGNLFVLFNKIDHLRERYGGETESVIADLLHDLGEKLATNAGLRLKPAQLFPISAANVLQARRDGLPTDANSRFGRVEQLLAGYQVEKHRRRAKEQNIGARKQRLTGELSELALGTENRSILEESRKLLGGWRGELNEALQAIPTEMLAEPERRGLRRSRLRAAGPQWGLPVSLIFTLLGELPWSRRSSVAPEAGELAARIYQHYRGFFEAIKNLQARFEAEFSGSRMADSGETSPPPAPTTTPQQWSAAMGAKVQSQIQNGRPQVTRWQKTACHLPAVATLLWAVWSRLYPLLDSVLGEGGFFSALAGTLLGTLNPYFLLGLVLALVLAYLVTGLVLWVRELQRLDGDISTAELSIREEVQEKGEEIFRQLEADLLALDSEFAEVEQLIES